MLTARHFSPDDEKLGEIQCDKYRLQQAMLISDDDMADWLEFVETLNDFVLSSDKLDRDIALVAQLKD